MTQLSLTLGKPKADAATVKAFVHLLEGMDDWITAADASEAMGFPDGERGKRMIRLCAEAACHRVISGQLGYRHTRGATVEEVQHYANWMKSQASKMRDRANAALNYKRLV